MDVSKAQFTILQGIVAHPDDPSVNDLSRMLLDLDTIQSELHELSRKGLVDTDTDIRRYRLVEDHTVIRESGLFAAQETLQHYFHKIG